MIRVLRIILFFGIVSCTSQLPDYSKAKKISVKEANAQLYKIRDDIKTKSDGFSIETKLNLVITDYAFQFPNEYKTLTLFKEGFDKKRLTSHSGFLKLCKSHRVDTAGINRYLILKNPEKL